MRYPSAQASIDLPDPPAPTRARRVRPRAAMSRASMSSSSRRPLSPSGKGGKRSIGRGDESTHATENRSLRSENRLDAKRWTPQGPRRERLSAHDSPAQTLLCQSSLPPSHGANAQAANGRQCEMRKIRVAVSFVGLATVLVAFDSCSAGSDLHEVVGRTSQALNGVVVSLDHNRNRLLDTLAQVKGSPDRCTLWNSFTNIQKGLFLTHTDMLGNRSCMENSSIYSNELNSGNNCDSSVPCNCLPGSDMALDHVYKIWTINGNDPSCQCTEGSNGYNCCNGGGEWHRTFFGADNALIGYFRNYTFGLPEWGGSATSRVPTLRSTMRARQPKEAHAARRTSGVTTPTPRSSVATASSASTTLKSWNWTTITTGSTIPILKGNTAERTVGRSSSGNWHWGQYNNTNRGNQGSTDFRGNGEPGSISELDQTNYGLPADDVWSPTCIAANITPNGVVNAVDYTTTNLHPGTWIAIFGVNFAAASQVVYIRTRSAISAIVPSYQSATQINAQIPVGSGTGEAYAYVASPSGLTNLQAITILP